MNMLPAKIKWRPEISKCITHKSFLVSAMDLDILLIIQQPKTIPIIPLAIGYMGLEIY